MALNGQPENRASAAWLRRTLALALGLMSVFAAPSRADRAANTIHFELLGNGLFYSINYDRLITSDFSARVGYMYISADAVPEEPTDPKVTISLSLIPITGSYLAGPGNHRLEVGGGPVFAFASAEIDDGVQGVSGSGLVSIVGIFGYRYQPVDGGFNFRVAATPHIMPEAEETFLPWGGLSLGYTF